MALMNGTNPADGEIYNNRNDTYDPDTVGVVRAVVAEDNSEDDTAQVTEPSHDTRDST